MFLSKVGCPLKPGTLPKYFSLLSAQTSKGISAY